MIYVFTLLFHKQKKLLIYLNEIINIASMRGRGNYLLIMNKYFFPFINNFWDNIY